MYISFEATPSGSGLPPSKTADLPTDVETALEHAQILGAQRQTPGNGNTASQWETLAALSAHDLGVGRAIEPHLDAVAILVQAGWSDIKGS